MRRSRYPRSNARLGEIESRRRELLSALRLLRNRAMSRAVAEGHALDRPALDRPADRHDAAIAADLAQQRCHAAVGIDAMSQTWNGRRLTAAGLG
jgi:hypothetical protein